MASPLSTFWQQKPEVLYQLLGTSAEGLSSKEAASRLAANPTVAADRPDWMKVLLLFLSQFKTPLVLMLVFAVLLSASLGETTNAILILSILLLTGILGCWQEFRADKAVKKLQGMLQMPAFVKRDGQWISIHLSDVAPGDVVRLSAGNLVPGDCLLIWEKDLHVNEAALTGESFPVEKKRVPCPADTPLSRRANSLFQGSSIVNGEAEALVVKTGKETELGKMVKHLETSRHESAFEAGINRFGYLLMRLTFLLAAGILILNLFLDRPLVASLLFALALAVGLAPELLPAIVVATLSAGATRMARKKVIVKKLSAIQNLGAVNILCSDKTGTLTTGEVNVHSAAGLDGRPSDKVLKYAYLNARYETGFSNPLDEALRKLERSDVEDFHKLDEVPYDFIRKRLSIVVEKGGQHLMITKGALKNVLDACTQAEDAEGRLIPVAGVISQVMRVFEDRSSEGLRTIGVAWKDVTGDPVINKDDEQGLNFLGFIFLYDPPKPGIENTIKSLGELGVALKIITGDSRFAARHTAELLGIRHAKMLTGDRLRHISDEALPNRVMQTDLFAEVEPHQKERLIRAVQRAGNVVGYLGDGINDASALRTADAGISVDSAVDVAREAADLVLLEKDLNVLQEGILEGRKTYLNTLKYIFITTSANFGNMFSLAGISLLIPFLPMLPQQILLLNFFSDIPALGIAGDQVDKELLARPKRWDVRLIRRFMTVFGIQSSLFDYLTFALLLLVFKVNEAHFQTGWFLESVLTELSVLMLIRTTRPFFRSRPGRFLLFSGLLVAGLTISLPYLPLGAALGFDPLPLPLLAGMIVISLLYALIVEVTKGIFFKKVSF